MTLLSIGRLGLDGRSGQLEQRREEDSRVPPMPEVSGPTGHFCCIYTHTENARVQCKMSFEASVCSCCRRLKLALITDTNTDTTSKTKIERRAPLEDDPK